MGEGRRVSPATAQETQTVTPDQHISNASMRQSSSSAWEAAEQPSRQTGYLGVWVFGCLDAWMFGCLEALDVWMFGCLDVWMCGCLDAWMFGCLDVWMLGCLDTWVFGCLDVWMFGCLEHNTADSDADRKGTVTTLGWEAEPSGGPNQPNKKYHSFSEHFKITSNHKGWNLVKKTFPTFGHCRVR